jgi:hypothetical protein
MKGLLKKVGEEYSDVSFSLDDGYLRLHDVVDENTVVLEPEQLESLLELLKHRPKTKVAGRKTKGSGI